MPFAGIFHCHLMRGPPVAAHPREVPGQTHMPDVLHCVIPGEAPEMMRRDVVNHTMMDSAAAKSRTTGRKLGSARDGSAAGVRRGSSRTSRSEVILGQLPSGHAAVYRAVATNSVCALRGSRANAVGARGAV